MNYTPLIGIILIVIGGLVFSIRMRKRLKPYNKYLIVASCIAVFAITFPLFQFTFLSFLVIVLIVSLIIEHRINKAR